MFRNVRDDKDLHQAKQEAGCFSDQPTLAATNSRIVRVSGGKDRHSKVNTIRGLRDRRIRLSVQTAIQLYDLQDKLGVNQPSKVVDWLLTAAQHEINKLPPLQFPPWINFPHPANFSIDSSSAIGNNVEDLESLHKSKFWFNKEYQEYSNMVSIGMNSSSYDLQNNGLVAYGSLDHWQTSNSNIALRYGSSNQEQNLQCCQLGLNSGAGAMIPYSTEPVYFPVKLGHYQAGSSSQQPQ